jgi:hypothetical protein
VRIELWYNIHLLKFVQTAHNFLELYLPHSWASWITLTAAGLGALGDYIFALVLEHNNSFVVRPWMYFLLYQAMKVIVMVVSLLFYKLLDKAYDFLM